ncbi:hypothetical protein [Roseomonas fluvialis]|uniref:Uncharacterized protein n=1 Tax=Roseomonas fluvialis TaxID=1750527 RepID=A0ABN6NYE1_9PROT|nr:hypothetical protein [Roseomonas fluvialis]BDG71085.1 hypothetical protein Rmf_10140 [Roseomonas fluvialis]
MPVFLKWDGIDDDPTPPPPPPPPANGGGRDGKVSDLSADPGGRADGGGTGKTLSATLLGKPGPIGGEADAHASDAFFFDQTGRLEHTSPDDGASFVMNDMIPAEPTEQFDLMGSEPDLGVLPLEQMALNFTRVDWD